jgi:hypothetical protein
MEKIMDFQTETLFRRIGHKKGFLFRRIPELVFGFDLRGVGTLYTSSDPKEILKILYIMRQVNGIKPEQDAWQFGGDHRDMLDQVTERKPNFPRSGFLQWHRKDQVAYNSNTWINLHEWLTNKGSGYQPLVLPQKKK